MREFSKVSPAVWGSHRFNDLPSQDGKFLYLYLLTCEHQTSAGVFKLKNGYATDDLKWTREQYLAARVLLIEADLIRFDEATSSVRIVRWFKHNPPMNESHFKGVAKVVLKLPCEQFRDEAMAELQEAFDQVLLAKAIQSGKAPPTPINDLSPQMKSLAARNGLGVVPGRAA